MNAEVQTVYLEGADISPCNACDACHQENADGCVIKDDMQDIYTAIIESDAIVFATPIYWFTVSAQLKTAMDRCYALISEDSNPFSDKRIALAMTFGAPDPLASGCTNVIQMFQDICSFTGAEFTGMVYGSFEKAGAIKSDTALLERARELGTSLVKE